MASMPKSALCMVLITTAGIVPSAMVAAGAVQTEHVTVWKDDSDGSFGTGMVAHEDGNTIIELQAITTLQDRECIFYGGSQFTTRVYGKTSDGNWKELGNEYATITTCAAPNKKSDVNAFELSKQYEKYKVTGKREMYKLQDPGSGWMSFGTKTKYIDLDS